MSDLSRREFFRRATHDLAEQVNLEAAKSVLGSLSAQREENPLGSWVAIGRMAEFAPGVVRRLEVGAITLTVRARAEGLWAECRGAERVALRTEAGGVVLANVSEVWPANRMLSHLTGEATTEENADEPKER